MQTPSPLNGNAVITTTTITTIVAVVIQLLRVYGYQITGDQENVILDTLRGPVGEFIIAAVFFIGQWIARSRVYSILSVEKLTGEVEPTVP